MGEIGGLAAGGGLFALLGTLFAGLGTVIGYLLVSNRRDRRQYEETIDKIEVRAAAAEQRTQAAWAVVEEARHGRHVAEDALAELRRARGVDP